MNRKHLILFLAGYTILFFLLFPGYSYLLDPDATGYLSVAEHLANGNLHDSINGIWSPLNSWILTPFLSLGFDGILAEKYLNGIYGFFSLTAFFYLIKKLRIGFFYGLAIMFSTLLLMLCFVFSRMFGDVLQLLFMLLYLNIICSEKFCKNYRSVIAAAVIGGLAFYVKAYILFFTALHLPIAIYLTEKKIYQKIRLKFVIKKTAIALAVLLIIVTPWIIILNGKYGHFIPGEKQISGSLTVQYTQPGVLFYPPPYNNSYSVFDDISFTRAETITPFSSTRLFVVQCKLIAFNFFAWIDRVNEFSFAFILTMIAGIYFYFFKRKQGDDNTTGLLLSVMIAWSAGFLILHVESRFLWIIDLCALALAGMLLSRLWNNKGKNYYLAGILIIGSFCFFPYNQLNNTYGSGKNNFEIAEAFRKNNIRGNILTSYQNPGDLSRSIIINYLSKCRHYGPFAPNYTIEEIRKAIDTYAINYFILYYNSPFQKQLLLAGELASRASTVYQDIYPGIIVLGFNR